MEDPDRVWRHAKAIASAVCQREARGVPPARIEELVQETLEVAWRKIEAFDEDHASFEAWVRGIAKNVCRNETRKRRDLLTEDGVIELTDPASTALRRMLKGQREALLATAIEAALDGIEQDVVYHRYVHGLEREKIAALVGLRDADHVRDVLSGAVRRLRKELLARAQALGHGVSLMRSDS